MKTQLLTKIALVRLAFPIKNANQKPLGSTATYQAPGTLPPQPLY